MELLIITYIILRFLILLNYQVNLLISLYIHRHLDDKYINNVNRKLISSNYAINVTHTNNLLI